MPHTGPGFGEHRGLQQRVQGVQGHQVHAVAEHLGEFVGELLDFPPSRPGCSVQRMAMSSRAAPEGPIPCRLVSVLPVAASRAFSSLFAAFLRW